MQTDLTAGIRFSQLVCFRSHFLEPLCAWIAIEFLEWQTNTCYEELICSQRIWRRVAGLASNRYHIVLVNSVSTHPKSANESFTHPLVNRGASWKENDAVLIEKIGWVSEIS